MLSNRGCADVWVSEHGEYYNEQRKIDGIVQCAQVKIALSREENDGQDVSRHLVSAVGRRIPCYRYGVYGRAGLVAESDVSC